MTINRRTLLKAATTMAAAASLQRPLFAATPRELVLVDSNLNSGESSVAHSMRARAEPQAIQADLVRQWRDGLGREVAACGCTWAYVRWDKAMLLADLARESGLKVRQRRLDRCLFEIRIGTASSA